MNELNEIIRSIKMYIETDKLAGLEELLIKGEDEESIRNNRNKEGKINKAMLEELRKRIEESKCCKLYKRRTNLVFGSGSPDAKLMFIGEAPGADEDLQGEPFVGRAGQLLTKMIEAMGMRREEVYIANILKCRPPSNRSPLPEEIAVCSPFLTEQINIVRPKIICALGKFAAQFLLKSTQPITALRGKFYETDGVKIMPTFHPAYLLRNPNDKRLVWEDLKKIRDELKKI